ncbi:MAG: hypothetical protein MJY96_06975 [Bacteroidaceae bacterium]|nr:hypothetical protein [Bacteroidaceae bacterium]
MKKTILALLVFCMAGVASAQTEKPERIVTFVKEMHNAAWYAHQADLWEKEVNRNPENDDAWYFWFTATRYRQMFESETNDWDEAPLVAIKSRVQKERPNSFARYVIDDDCRRLIHDNEGIEDHMNEAIRMRPDFEELYSKYVVHCMTTGNDRLMEDIMKRWYNTGHYSYVLLSYAYNCLAGMEDNGILVTNGDTDTFSALMIRYGKGLFTGKTVICRGLLYDPDYLEDICHRMGVENPGLPQSNESDDLQKWEEDLFFSIAHTSGRPLYFCATSTPNYFRNQLYSEGLVNRYSTKRYDNLAVKRRNFEEVYFKDYLYETFVPETYEASAFRLNLNYIPCFKSLLNFYKSEGLKQEYDELHGLMTHIVKECEGIEGIDPKIYYDEIER